MTFERTRNWTLVKSIVTHPAIYPHVSDDFAAKPEDWKATDDEGLWYVLAMDGDELLGMFLFIPQNEICWDVHTCLLPKSYGSQAEAAGRGMIRWVWENTRCLRIVTLVPEYNRLALSFAKRCGLVCYGVNPKSYMKRGTLHDSILLGISKPDGVLGELSR
jgi:RimJ/RimL family protein N-acetyltransferase